MNYNSYSAFSRRALFPPVVPNSIPAFDGRKMYQIFFKKSAANFMTGGQTSEFKHIQISVRRVDNNSNTLDTAIHKTGYVIAPLSSETIDSPGFEPQVSKVYKVYSRDDKSPYCVFLGGLDSSLPSFKELNTVYKVQIRLGELEYNPNWTVADIQKMNADGKVSEWSTVLTMKPIDAPSFGVQGFKSIEEDSDKNGNTIATANFEYVGYYDSTFVKTNEQGVPVFSTVNEKLSEYWFKLLDASGKLLSDSGSIVTIEHDRPNLSHSFNYLTQDMTDYYVIFGIKTENGFTKEKKYLVKANYKVLQMSNAMVRVSNERDQARMKVEVKAKQVVLEPILKKGSDSELSKLGFVKDTSDPQYKNLGILDQQKILTTHAVIEGTAQTSKSFYLSCPNDTWVLEAKLSGLKCFKSRAAAMESSYLVLENDYSIERDILYMTRLILICYEEKEFDFGLDLNNIIVENGVKKFAPSTKEPKTIYYVEAIKTSYKKQNGVEIPIGSQSKKVRSVIKTDIVWPSDVPKIPIDKDIPVQPSVNRYQYSESRHTIKDTGETPLFDIKYFNEKEPSNPKVDSFVSKNRKTFSANESIPLDPKRECYIYLTNNLGSMTMFLFDDGYVTTHDSFIKYLETKKLQPDMEVEATDKFREKKER